MKNLGTKRIETERLILRRFTIEDAEAMYRNWAGDPEVTRFLTWPAHDSVETTRAVLAHWTQAYADDSRYEWCIAWKETNEPLGSIGVVHINEKTESVEVGYCIGRAYWNQGITSEALAAVIRFLFTEVGVNRVEAGHDIRNPHSGMAMEKCGMRREGIRRQAGWNSSGISDVAIYGLLKKDLINFASAGYAGAFKENSVPDADADAADDAGERGADGSVAPTEGHTPKNVISDETIDYVGILAKLELNEKEKEQAKKDMGAMLDYIDKLNELDTTGVEPMSHIFPVNNVFREDVVTNGDGSVETLKNAPVRKDGGFKVPKTIG